jgi:polysaccharide deacetylase 2 family uncharacterized protein YibQ
VRSGVERARLKRNGNDYVVETLLDPSTLAERLHRNIPGARVTAYDDRVRVQAAGEKWNVAIRKLQVADSGAGLVEADEPERVDKVVSSRVATNRHGSKIIALILDDVGFDRQPLAEAASIHSALTFAVIPHTPNAVAAARSLNAKGFEILCHLPMEPDDYPRMNPGNGAILTSMSDAEIQRRTREGLQSIPFARGVNNHMGSRATSDARVMRSVMKAIHDEGAFFVDSRTSASSVGLDVARESQVRTVARNVFLDDIERADAIRHQLDLLAALAEKNGVAVGIGHVYPVTISVLRQELPRLEREGFRFVPVSQLVE